MSAKLKGKIILDIVMLITLLFTMSHLIAGIDSHEYLGTLLFILLVVHNILNISWYKNLFKGKYTITRYLHTIINILTIASIIFLFISGMIFASYTPNIIKTAETVPLARQWHMLGAYWGFILMSLHLGLHWLMIMGILKKYLITHHVPDVIWQILKFVAVIIMGYGIYSFIKHDIVSYLFLQNEFVFIDENQSLINFVVNYLSIVGMEIWFIYYIFKGINQMKKKSTHSKIKGK